MTTVFDQADVTRLTGIGPVLLRAWRYRKLIEGVGQQEKANGPWSYKSGDVVVLACVRWLYASGLVSDLTLAVEIAKLATPQVWDFIRFATLGKSFDRLPRYMIVPPQASAHTIRWAIEFPTPAIHGLAFPAFLIVDCQRLAVELLPALGGMVSDIEGSWEVDQ